MAGYKPQYISGMETGLVQSRENFLLPNDAYPQLINAYVWRERILRKHGYRLVGRLQRNFISSSLGNSLASLTWTFIFYSTVVPPIIETTASIRPGSVIITDGTDTFTDQGDGTLKRQDGNITSTINYITGSITLNRTTAVSNAFTVTFSYYPGLPVMGIRTKDNQNSITNTTVFFDQVYAYDYNGTSNQFEEFMAGTTNTTWTGNNSQFFWSTNYWISAAGIKIFWATNNKDPIRYTDGQNGWVDFAPVIDSNIITPGRMTNALIMLPFRGRMVAFNVTESSSGMPFTNRIRWAAIGTPFDVSTVTIPVNINVNAWKDDIRGQGGFLDIPTNEDIVSVGFVRDNLVIYCENSTWQLRYTGRSIAPFQIEKVNSEIGSSGTFSSIQFDTSLLCIGPKGIVECDSFKSDLIDIKIPDFVFNELSNSNNGQARVHGIRDFVNRLAYWTYNSTNNPQGVFPNSRLVYNYENSSWAIFTDSLTTLGIFQLSTNPRWIDIDIPWIEIPWPWIYEQTGEPVIVGGNQQGFIEELDILTTNEASLFISNIIGHTTTSTEIISPNHNLTTDMIIQISGIPTGTPFDNLNNGIFMIVNNPSDPANSFFLNVFDSATGQFNLPQLDDPETYIGGGLIAVRDNFSIVSKKFNYMEQGQNIQMGYLDILLNATENNVPGSISLNIYLDYNDYEPINTYIENSDTFFNTIIPTSSSSLNTVGGTKFWQRVICPVRGNFITLEYTFNNAQMAGIEQQLDVQIDAQVLWMRQAGRMTQG